MPGFPSRLVLIALPVLVFSIIYSYGTSIAARDTAELASAQYQEDYNEDGKVNIWVIVDNTGNDFGWLSGNMIYWKAGRADDPQTFHIFDYNKTTVKYEFNGQEYTLAHD